MTTKRLSFSFSREQVKVIQLALKEFYLNAPATVTDNSPETKMYVEADRLKTAIMVRLQKSEP